MTDQDENPIDKIIRQAREEGAFDNLPGKGKPMQWEDESMVPEDQRAAHRLLRGSGHAPDFIALGRELDAQYAALRAALEQARRARGDGRLSPAGWQAAQDEFQAAVRALNRRVIGYNMRAPAQLARLPFSLDPNAGGPAPRD